jgi:Uri superfamily endonuclease
MGQIPEGPRTMNACPGTYALILYNSEPRTILIGKHGDFWFPKGYYVYTGSAFGSGGLAARVGRHLKSGKPLWWHIDYLTSCLSVVRVWHTRHPEPRECLWAVHFETIGGTITVPGFGSSDCRCRSHLFQFDRMPRLSAFRQLTSPVSSRIS